jgi:hypothetical protein
MNKPSLSIVEKTESMTSPTVPGEWTLAQIQAALSRPLPASMLATRKQGGQNLTYIPWHVANKILDKYALGWQWEIRNIQTTGDRLFLTGRLSIPTSHGVVYREATGTEELKETVTDRKTGEVIIREIAYGDPSSNSESMAFRRAAARFGLGLYLYQA